MEFNIALSTIIYLLIFLLPGFLFRNFYHRSAHKKQFNNGNLFERFLTTLLLSISIISLLLIIYKAVDYFFGFEVYQSISYSSIANIINTIGDNKLPEETEINELYLDFSTFFASLYFFSAVTGFLSYFINNELNIFKYSNYWENLFYGYNLRTNSNEKHAYTIADVLVENTSGNRLYRGRVEDYFITKENKLDTLILSNALRFKKNGSKVEEKKIPGHILCLKYENIININLTNIKEKKSNIRYFQKISQALAILFTLVIIGLVVLIFLDIENFIDLWYKKIAFSFISILLLGVIYSVVNNKILGELKIKLFKDNLIVIIFLSISYLWIFNLLSFWLTFSISFGYLMLLTFLKSSSKKNK